MNNNFLQVGRMNECGKCHPEKGYLLEGNAVFREYGIKCNCICHDLNRKQEKIRCSKCGSPFADHHRQHEIDNKFYHTGCKPETQDREALVQESMGQVDLDNQERELPPAIGVSQWRNYGIKYKYWDFFRNEIIKEIEKLLNSLKKEGHLSQCNIKERNSETCGWCLIGNSQYNNVINDILKKIIS